MVTRGSAPTVRSVPCQQQRVRARYPHTPIGKLKLLPTDRRNPDGSRAITGFSISFHHRAWINTIPDLRTVDGIEFDKRRVVLYAYRHSYAQRHADAGVPIDVLRQLMDHSKLDTTKRYYKPSGIASGGWGMRRSRGHGGVGMALPVFEERADLQAYLDDLLRTRGRLRAAIGADQLDLAQFQQLIEDARAAGRESRWGEAAQRYRDAVGCGAGRHWRAVTRRACEPRRHAWMSCGWLRRSGSKLNWRWVDTSTLWQI